MSGVLVTLTDSSGSVVATTLTGSDGSYVFEDIPDGTYTVEEETPEGLTDVSDSDGGDPNSVTVTITEGEDATSVDFVDEEEETGSISGTVTEDTDDDNEGDSPLSGVLVTLTDSSGIVVASTLTDSEGAYEFSDVPAGDYTVSETDPMDLISVSDIDGSDNTDNAIDVTVGGDDPLDSTGNDFVDEKPDETGSISGTVFEDTDDDNEGDEPLSGVVVELKDDGNVVATTLTGSDGSYVFEDVAPGTYTVEEENPEDLTDVSDSDGGDPNSVTVTIPEEGGDVT